MVLGMSGFLVLVQLRLLTKPAEVEEGSGEGWSNGAVVATCHALTHPSISNGTIPTSTIAWISTLRSSSHPSCRLLRIAYLGLITLSSSVILTRSNVSCYVILHTTSWSYSWFVHLRVFVA